MLHRDTEPACIEECADGSRILKWFLHSAHQQTTVIQPEPGLEDLVKPAFSAPEDKRELAAGLEPDGRESVDASEHIIDPLVSTGEK